MTVDELIEWFESAKRQSPDREVGDYDLGELDPVVDHHYGTVNLGTE